MQEDKQEGKVERWNKKGKEKSENQALPQVLTG